MPAASFTLLQKIVNGLKLISTKFLQRVGGSRRTVNKDTRSAVRAVNLDCPEDFSRVVHQCVEAGLVAGSKIHVDASLVDAYASLNSVKALQAQVVAAIDCAAREQVQKLDEQDDDEREPPADVSGAAAPQSEVGKTYKANREFRRMTDPDATLVRHSGLKSRPRHKTHRVVDDAHEIITAVETTTGAVDEGQRMLELIQAHGNLIEKPEEVITFANLSDSQIRDIAHLLKRGWRFAAAFHDVVERLTPDDEIRALHSRAVAQGGQWYQIIVGNFAHMVITGPEKERILAKSAEILASLFST
jgi:hypothetical protein